MEHDAVIEAIELAALEPGGLDRLMAGDTPTSQAVAGHLAGCTACTAVLAAMERDARVIADVVATTPAADLRDRTLATVRVRGVPRGVAAAPPISATALAGSGPPVPAAATVPATPTPPAPAQPRRRPTLGWVASIAAAVALSVGATALVMDARADADRATQAQTIDALRTVTVATIDLSAEPDATRVALAGTQDPAVQGSLVFSPTSTGLVVVATGLTEPGPGLEYGCWMDAGAGRVRVGRMYFGGSLAYWVGESAAVAGLDVPATFGVSLVPVGSSVEADPVLVGRS
jgi:hypothetical protein